MVDRGLSPLLVQGRLTIICPEFTCYWTCLDVGSRTRVEDNHFVDPRMLVTTLEDISTLTQPHLPDDWTEIDSTAVDTVRVLAADAVQKTGNGHPGTAMSLAPLAYTLFQRTMRHDPGDTHWLGRDRFVLSAGHSSLTLYIQLYLGGFGL